MKHTLKSVRALAATLITLGSLAGGASAAITFADFRTESNLPDFVTGTPKVYQSLSTSVDVGLELDSADLLSNPDNWSGGSVTIDLNPITLSLVLDSQDTLDFQTFTVSITNIQFSGAEAISGVSLISNNLTTSPSIAPVISWTDDSISIVYSAIGLPDNVFNFTGDSASFQITTAAVPEPSSALLLGLGTLAVFARRRRN
jgi:hypothetical protein